MVILPLIGVIVGAIVVVIYIMRGPKEELPPQPLFEAHWSSGGKFLTLEGLLDGSPTAKEVCYKIIPQSKYLHTPGMTITIHAHNLNVIPGGVTLWIRVVNQLFAEVNLHYLDSQLADIVRFDECHNDVQATYESPADDRPNASSGKDAPRNTLRSVSEEVVLSRHERRCPNCGSPVQLETVHMGPEYICPLCGPIARL